MKRLIPFALLCFSFIYGARGQVNTFSECYYTYDQNNQNADNNEILYDAKVDANGDYIVFGKQSNESVFPLNSKSQILHQSRLNANGVNVNNLEFIRNLSGSNISITNINHSELYYPLCTDMNWILVNETKDKKSEVVAYSFDNSFSTVNNIFNLTDQTNNADYYCNDFIQNSNKDIIWAGSEKSGAAEDIFVSTFRENCLIGLQQKYQILDPITNKPMQSKANSIIELQTPVLDEAVYALTGVAGDYAFCLILDQALNPVNGQIQLFKMASFNSNIDIGVKIKQLANNNLIILGNTQIASNNPGFDKFFLIELEAFTLNTVWSSIYNYKQCTNATDFEINSNGDFIVVGSTDYSCGGKVYIPQIDPGWAFMTEINHGEGSVNWAYQHHQNKKYNGSAFGTSFREVELIQGENLDEIFAVGTCWERIKSAISDSEDEDGSEGDGESDGDPESGPYFTNFDYLAVKTDTNGELLDNTDCYESIELVIKNDPSKRYVQKPKVFGVEESQQGVEKIETSLNVESEFCDQTDICCQDDSFYQLLNQMGSFSTFGCESITVNLNAVGPCWQVTWDWGDGTTTGPIPATTDQITHNYSQNANGYYITYYIEEIDLNGNVCNSGFSDFGVAIYTPTCECDECPGGGFSGAELITNGGFNNLYTSFSSDFANSACSGYGQSYIHNNKSISLCNVHWCGTGTTGYYTPSRYDKFLVGDAFYGDPINRDVLWEQTITGIEVNSIYTFCGLFKNLLISASNPNKVDPVVDIEINGQLKISNFTVPFTFCETTSPWACDWNELNFLWNSGNDTNATIKIYLHRTECYTPNCGVFGGDLGVEDLSFKKCTSAESEGIAESNEVIIDQVDFVSQSDSRNNDREIEHINIFPNPTDALINLEFETSQERVVHVLSVTGKQMAKKNIANKQAILDLSQFNNGLYMVMIENVSTGKRITKLITKTN